LPIVERPRRKEKEGVYLAIHDPKLLDRRMRGGPAAEKERSQKIIMFLVMMGFLGLLVVPAFDHRFGWSRVPMYVCLLGDALIGLGFLLVLFVAKVNTYAASTIQVAEDQKIISTGPYAFVRHPMYGGSFPILIGTPLGLGSWWGLSALIVFVPALIWRLVDEESFLRKNLPGYREYTDKVRYRLVPYVW
jgi:protein-S-isoprenylcysteine O-methyltransferase Ste14